MDEVCCKRCGAADYMKNGTVRDLQRYRCRACGCNFTMTPSRGKPSAMKALAVLLYAMGGMSFRAIARILGVSNVAILNWVRDEARQIPDPPTKVEQVVVTLDEMWHFIKKKLANSGFGEPMTLLVGEPSPGFLVAVMTPHANGSSTKSASKVRPSSRTTGRGITVSSPKTNSSQERI
jgi:transposase-like protein